MLYPVAKSLLVAQNNIPELHITEGDKSFELQGDLTEEQAKDRYRAEITELDTGTLPRGLMLILNAWGIQVSDLTEVAPERSYLSEVEIEPGEKLEPSVNYIWLLTGVRVNGRNMLRL